MEGGVVSATTTSKLQALTWPAASLTEQCTVVVPTGKLLPEAWSQVGANVPSQMSLAVTTKLTIAWPPPLHSAAWLAGQLIEGGVVSCTVTSKLQVEVCPAASLTEQCTVVVP